MSDDPQVIDIEKDVLTLHQVCDVLERRFGQRFSKRTVQKWCQDGDMPGAVRKGGDEREGGNSRRAVWLVPRLSAENFTPPSHQ